MAISLVCLCNCFQSSSLTSAIEAVNVRAGLADTACGGTHLARATRTLRMLRRSIIVLSVASLFEGSSFTSSFSFRSSKVDIGAYSAGCEASGHRLTNVHKSRTQRSVSRKAIKYVGSARPWTIIRLVDALQLGVLSRILGTIGNELSELRSEDAFYSRLTIGKVANQLHYRLVLVIPEEEYLNRIGIVGTACKRIAYFLVFTVAIVRFSMWSSSAKNKLYAIEEHRALHPV